MAGIRARKLLNLEQSDTEESSGEQTADVVIEVPKQEEAFGLKDGLLDEYRVDFAKHEARIQDHSRSPMLMSPLLSFGLFAPDNKLLEVHLKHHLAERVHEDLKSYTK